MSLLEAHREFLRRALDQLTQDPRLAAVLVSGSTGRGEEDEWSDLDLVVVCDESTATGTFHDLVVSRPRRVIPPYSRQQRAEWELCMCHLALSLPVRHRDARQALLTIGITGDPGPHPADQVKAIRGHIEGLQPWIAPRALQASLQRVDVATSAL